MSASRRPAALVIGGGRGLGRAVAERLAVDGRPVAVFARTASETAETARIITDAGGRSRALCGDVRDADSVHRAARAAEEWAGGLDVVVHAAGCLRAIGPIGVVDPADWWTDVETPLRGLHHVARAVVGPLRQSAGCLLTLVGPGTNGELAHASGYAAAQAGLVRLVESLDAEWDPLGIRVYAVNPGLVPTGIVQGVLDSEAGRRWLPRFTEAFAEGKEVGPEPAAEMAAWLAAERPRELSGRVVSALLPPELLATRLVRIQADDLGRLRLR